MPTSTLRRRLAATAAAGALGIAGFAILGPSPASAVPGDAAAVGIASTLQVTVAQGALNASVDGSLGAVNAPRRPRRTSSMRRSGRRSPASAPT